jgi:hypothetical protein
MNADRFDAQVLDAADPVQSRRVVLVGIATAALTYAFRPPPPRPASAAATAAALCASASRGGR